MAKKIDPKAKAKRQKIYAAVGGVILLGVLAFQVPRTMKMLHPSTDSSSSSTPASTTPGPTASPIAAPSLSGGNVTASATSSSGDGLADTDAVPAPASGQLLAFGLFRTKDPFRQQLSANGPTGATGVSTAGTTKPKPKPSEAPQGPTGTVGVTPGGTTSTTPVPVRVLPTSAVISVNGSPQTVQVGGTFPSSDPFFKLVSLTRSAAKISIAGGSLENGAPSVKLVKGKAITLLNTADGTRYVLRLLSVS